MSASTEPTGISTAGRPNLLWMWIASLVSQTRGGSRVKSRQNLPGSTTTESLGVISARTAAHHVYAEQERMGEVSSSRAYGRKQGDSLAHRSASDSGCADGLET